MASYVRVSTETCRRNLSIADAQSSYAAQRLNFHPMENSGGINQSLISSHCRVTFILGILNARTAVHVQSSITPVTGRIIHVLTKSYFISIPGNQGFQGIRLIWCISTGRTQVPQVTETWSLSSLKLHHTIWLDNCQWKSDTSPSGSTACCLHLQVYMSSVSKKSGTAPSTHLSQREYRNGFTLLLFTHHN